MAGVSRPHFDNLPLLTRTRLNLGAGSGRALALSEAGKSRDANLLMALAERFYDDRELHLVIMRNPAAARAPEVLGTIEQTCRSVLLRLPFVRELMLAAKDTQNDDLLAGFVLSPLKVVRMTTCFNPRIGHLQQTAHEEAVREAIPANRRLLETEKTRDFLRALDLGSGELPRPATPAPPTSQVVKSPVPATAPVPPPDSDPRSTPNDFWKDDVRALPLRLRRTPPAPAKPSGGGPAVSVLRGGKLPPKKT